MSRSLYSKPALLAYLNQQIIEDADIVMALEIVKRVMPKFANKQVNKRISTAINAELDKVFKNSQVYFSSSFYESCWLKIVCRDNDTYPASKDKYGYSSTNYVDYETQVDICYIDKDNHVVDIEKTMISINGRLEGYRKHLEQMQNEVVKMNEIEKEYNAIKKQVEDFNNKYTYLTREVYKF